VDVGIRMHDLQVALRERVKELEEALKKVHTLQGLLPICSYCKKIRDDQNYWTDVESYLATYSDAEFSHGVCPDCFARYLQPRLDELRRAGAGKEDDRAVANGGGAEPSAAAEPEPREAGTERPR
jgi:hypothetical protein